MKAQMNRTHKVKDHWIRKRFFSGILPLFIFSFFVLCIHSNVLAFSSVYKENQLPEELNTETSVERENQNQELLNDSPFSIFKRTTNEKLENSQINPQPEEHPFSDCSGPSFYKGGKLPDPSLSQPDIQSLEGLDRINLLGRPSLYKSNGAVVNIEPISNTIEPQPVLQSPFKKEILEE